MSKSPEEIKSAVLKECERLTAGVPVRAWVYPLWQDQEYRPSVGVMRASYSGEIPVFGCIFFFKEFAVSDAILTGNPELTLAIYRLLNLEAKEIEDRLKFTIGKLDEETWERQAAERKVMELEENSELLTKYKDDLPEIVKYIKGHDLHSEIIGARILERAQGLVDALKEIAAVKSGKSTIKALGYVELSFKMSELAETALNQWKGGGNGQT